MKNMNNCGCTYKKEKEIFVCKFCTIHKKLIEIAKKSIKLDEERIKLEWKLVEMEK